MAENTRIDPSSSGAATNVTTDPTKLVELIKKVRVAMFVTFPNTAQDVGIGTAALNAGHAGLHARPMYTQKLEAPDADSPNRFTGELWFMTDASSTKVRELEQDQQVLINYSDEGKNVYVAVYGVASVERNPQKAQELWNVHAKGWWPGGPEDPNLVLIRVRVHSAEYWNGPSNTSYMLNLLKAVVSGDRVKLEGEHGEFKG